MADSKDEVVTDLERLHEGCRRGQKAGVYEAIQKSKKLIDEPGNLGWACLHWAASAGHAEVVEMLLHAGANPDLQNESLDTPLHLAAWKDNVAAVKMLLKYNASKTIVNKDGKTPPQLARSDAMKEVIPELSQEEVADLVTVADDEDDEDDDTSAYAVGATAPVVAANSGGAPKPPAPRRPPPAGRGPAPAPPPKPKISVAGYKPRGSAVTAPRIAPSPAQPAGARRAPVAMPRAAPPPVKK